VTAPLAKPALTLREALRASTQLRHEALDRALMPPGSAWTRARYHQFLRATLAVVDTLEPAIALTAHARVEHRARALHAGFNSHVPKPVDPVELFAVIASVGPRSSER
jgi:CheY-like chemotaxis protein